MATQTGFFREAWKGLRPKALAATIDIGEYVVLWAGLIVADVVKVIAATAGVDPEVIQSVSFMEKWAWIASFAAFFLRIVVRSWKSK
jgi:hypothetical protein